MTSVATPTRPLQSGHRGPMELLAGSWMLLRFMLRRDRLRLAAWTVGVGLLVAGTVPAVMAAYPDEVALMARAALMASPATVLVAGPLFGADDPSLGAVVANELVMFLLIVVAVMSILVAVRHTRGDEEAGRTELLRASPVGRFAPVTAAVLTVVVTNLAVGLAVAVGLIFNALAATDSVALAVASAATGLAYGAVAAVAAQVTSHARTATGMALGVLGVTFLLRAVGDVMEPATGSWLSWASPLAWAQQMRHYADLRWWPALLPLVAAVVLFVVAGMLSMRRDLGAGLREERPGPAVARRSLLAALGLAWRLLRGSFVAWTAGIVAFAVIAGSMVYAVEDMIADTPEVAEWLALGGGDLVGSYLAFLLRFIVVGASAMGVAVVLRFRGEEQAGRAELVISSGWSRTTWLVGWMAVVVGQVVAALVAGSLSVGIGAVAATEEGRWSGEVLGAGLAYVPAALAITSVPVVLVGLAPRLASLAWLLVGWVAFLVLFEGILDLPPALLGLSPVHLTPLVPTEPLVAAPLVVLSCAAVALAGAGVAGFVRRDVVAR